MADQVSMEQGGIPAASSDRAACSTITQRSGKVCEMKKRNDYAAQRLDPRWQKRRLEIMNRDGFACIDCGSVDKTLNVHHVYYTDGASIWEYPDRALVTLCCDCHEAEHQVAYESEKSLISNLKKTGIRSSAIGSMAFTIEMLIASHGHDEAKRIVEIIDFLAFRTTIDVDALEKLKALAEIVKSEGFKENA